MKLAHLAAFVVAASTGIGGAALAQSRTSAPAELPPASYNGAQYIDSRGCVFVRAGIDGNISWVPRLNRQRQHICNAAPTELAALPERPTADTQPVAVAAAAPVAPAAQSVQSVRAARVAPKVRATAPKPRAVAPAPVSAASRAAATAGVVDRTENGGLGPSVPSTSLPGSTRVLPLHVARQRANVGTFAVPKGYRPAWSDDRLNPRRAEGSLAGRDSMNLIWTTTVPRRLIDQSTGEDVTAKVALVYPYTSFRQQSQNLGKVTLITRGGKTLKHVRKRASRAAPLPQTTRQPASTAAPRETLSGKRYVQVGSFGVKANAQRRARDLKRLGLPVRIGKVARADQTLRLVLAGPFKSDADAQQALQTARGAGFLDAFVRK